MLVLVAIILALVSALVILYPFVRGLGEREFLDDESSPQAELERRWDSALVGLKNAELERAIGNLSEEDYGWLKEQYMTEAALVMKAMELEEQEEQLLLTSIEREMQRARNRVLGSDGAAPEIQRDQSSNAEAIGE